jgi:hypothetical protein
MLGVKYTARLKEHALNAWLVDNVHWEVVCAKYKCTRVSLWRWKTKYDGTLESLQNKSSKPLTPHPNSQTNDEKKLIETVLNENPTWSYTELFGELRANYAYSRHYLTMYKYIRKIKTDRTIEYEKRVPQKYNTPEMLGVKMQMDVKFVPRECWSGPKEEYVKLYQYTIIDEATRERFMFPYLEHNGWSSQDFTKRAMVYFGYLPETIQTDNGTEFTNPKGTNTDKVHILDKLLNGLRIKHKLIRPYTPRHNGKVERSHRIDQACFYNHTVFNSLDDLKDKMASWMVRYNNTPKTIFKDETGKRTFQSPIERRNDLLQSLKQNDGFAIVNDNRTGVDRTVKIRFIKTASAVNST